MKIAYLRYCTHWIIDLNCVLGAETLKRLYAPQPMDIMDFIPTQMLSLSEIKSYVEDQGGEVTWTDSHAAEKIDDGTFQKNLVEMGKGIKIFPLLRLKNEHFNGAAAKKAEIEAQHYQACLDAFLPHFVYEQTADALAKNIMGRTSIDNRTVFLTSDPFSQLAREIVAAGGLAFLLSSREVFQELSEDDQGFWQQDRTSQGSNPEAFYNLAIANTPMGRDVQIPQAS